MATRLFALIAGIFYAVFGIAGFIPSLVWRPEMVRLRMNALHFHGGQLGGFLETNWPHDILWLLIGIGGIVAAARFAWSRSYARGLFVAATLFTLIGLLPLGIGQLWGYLPLFGWNVLIHAVTAILAWYYGWVYPRAAELGMA
jgi:hypothetical protein